MEKQKCARFSRVAEVQSLEPAARGEPGTSLITWRRMAAAVTKVSLNEVPVIEGTATSTTTAPKSDLAATPVAAVPKTTTTGPAFMARIPPTLAIIPFSLTADITPSLAAGIPPFLAAGITPSLAAHITPSVAPATTTVPEEAAIVTETKGDLFAGAATINGSSVGHCVSQCLTIGKGIATEFKRRFASVNLLKSQNTPIGGVAILPLPSASSSCVPAGFAYYLVTKARYFQNPIYDALGRSLRAMRRHAMSHGVTRICLPRVGCGLDGLRWEHVKPMLSAIFAGTGIAIDVFHI